MAISILHDYNNIVTYEDKTRKWTLKTDYHNNDFFCGICLKDIKGKFMFCRESKLIFCEDCEKDNDNRKVKVKCPFISELEHEHFCIGIIEHFNEG